MSGTGEFLKKTSQELTDGERGGAIAPLSMSKKIRKKAHLLVNITLLISFLFSFYAIYDIYQIKQSSYTVVRNFLNTDDIVNQVEKILLKSLSLEEIKEKEIKPEDEVIKDIAEKSIKLPDLSSIPNQIPQINVPPAQIQQTQPIPEPIMSKYDFFVKKAKEFESVGNYRYAIFFYLRAFAEKQSDYNLKYKIATLYHQIGQDELAMESAKDALNIKPDYLPAIEFLMEIYNKSGKKPVGFIEILERAKNSYPNNKDIKYTLAKIYKENGDYKAYEEIISSIKE